MRFSYIPLLLIAFTQIIVGSEYAFFSLTSHNGLSQNDVLCAYQDSKGFMWFGTIDGLNRFDGYDFKIYRTEPKNPNSLSSSLVSCLEEDDKQNLWIGTLDQGICILNLRTQRTTRIQNSKTQPNLLTYNHIRRLKMDSKNRIWASTYKGLNCVQLQADSSFVIKQFVPDKNNPKGISDGEIDYIMEDRDGHLWFGGQHSIHRLNGNTLSLDTAQFELIVKSGEFRNIRDILEIKEGVIFSHSLGITFLPREYFDSDSKNYQTFSTISSRVMKLDSDTNLWIGGYSGLYKYDYTPKTNRIFVPKQQFRAEVDPNTLNNENIRCLTFDHTGTLWIGTNGGGISRYSPKRIKFRHYAHTQVKGSLSNNKVWCMFEDEDYNLWIGTEGGGINLLPYKNSKNYTSGFEQYIMYPDPAQNFIYDIKPITIQKIDELWVGSGYYYKLGKLKRNGEKWGLETLDYPSGRHVMCLHQDSNGVIWMGSYGDGLFRYDPDQENNQWIFLKETNSNLPSNIIRSFLEDSKGRLWVATSNGIARLNNKEKLSEQPVFEVFQNLPNDSSSLSHNYVVPMMEDREGNIWAGTFGGGLNRYQEAIGFKRGFFKNISVSNGLPNNYIKQIIEDNNGHLWISSNRGISKYEPATGKILNFDLYDGLQDWEFTDLSGCKLHDGEILFGGVNGFNAFNPQNFKSDSTTTYAVFTQFKLNNENIEPGQVVNGRIPLKESINHQAAIKLEYKENDFTIHFSALHYSVPEKNRFQYQLKGFDKEWHETSYNYRFAKYTNLPPGNYTFMVKVANCDGIWNPIVKTVHIQILPAFWHTWWFRILISLVCIALLITYNQLRLLKIRKQNTRLEEMVKVRTQEVERKNQQLNTQAIELIEINTALEEHQQEIDGLMTELKKQRDELYEINVALEERQQKIEEQTEELTVQRDELAEVNQVKDKLFSIVAHDLKNPMGTLAGFMEILEMKYDKYDDNKRKFMIRNAIHSIYQIQDLLINLLNWARSQSGEINFEPVSVNINNLIAQTLDLLSIQINEKQIHTKFTYQSKDILAVVDIDLMNAVFRNIITNAIKFTPNEGRIDIHSSIEDNTICISIKDSGIGISDEDLPKLFQKSIRFTTYGTAQEKGTGLGLITSKDFIELHRGQIVVESTPGQGTCFKISLPVDRR